MTDTLLRPTAAPGDGGTSTPARSARASAWMAVAAVVLALAVAPLTNRGGLPAGAAARLTSGRLDRFDGAAWIPVAAGDTVANGTRVRAPDGDAGLTVTDGSLTLAAGSEAVLARRSIDLDGGSVLVETSRSHTVTDGTVTADGQGTWRLDADTAPRVGVYRGGVAVRGASGREVALGRLTQTSLVDDVPGPDPMPLRYLAADPWDARLLPGAIAVDRQASRLVASLAASYGTRPRPASFYAPFAAATGAEALGALAPDVRGSSYGPPGEVLLGLVVVDMLRTRDAMTPQDALAEVTSLRRDGGAWGLILARHGLDSGDLRAAADRALRREQALGPTGGVAPGASAGAGEGATSGAPSSGSGEPTPAPSPTTEPQPSPPPDQSGPLDAADPVLDEADQAVDGVPGGHEAVDTVRTAVDTVDDLLSDPGGEVTSILQP